MTLPTIDMGTARRKQKSVGSIERLCVFCGASKGTDPAFATAAHELGTLLGQRGMTLVYGGGKIGMMGAVADAAIAAGAKVIGIIPEFLAAKELAHPDATDMRIVDSMHARKAAMAELAHAFVALPGGFGTLEEFVEILTWRQLDLHHKPIGLLNVNGLFDEFLRFADRLVAVRLLRAEHRALIRDATTAETLLDRLAEPHGGDFTKWLDRENLDTTINLDRT